MVGRTGLEAYAVNAARRQAPVVVLLVERKGRSVATLIVTVAMPSLEGSVRPDVGRRRGGILYPERTRDAFWVHIDARNPYFTGLSSITASIYPTPAGRGRGSGPLDSSQPLTRIAARSDLSHRER